MHLILPAPSESFDVELDDGTKIKMRRHGNSSGMRLLLSHGNGFAVDAYLPFWQHLLPKYDVLVFDFRNHGQNIPTQPSHHHYAQFARDLDRILDGVHRRLGQKATVGIFHSMSARAVMKHATEIGWKWDGLVLFDPPNVPPIGHPCYRPMQIFEGMLKDWALNRRRQFATIEELADEYRRARAHRGWVAGAQELMARSVLRPHPDGNGYSLVCAPENEAAIYAEAVSLNLWPQAREFRGPVKLIGADPDLAGGPPTGQTNRVLAAENGYDYDFVPGTGHLLQIEKPDACARLIEDFLVKNVPR